MASKTNETNNKPQSPLPSEKSKPPPLITEEADRALGRILIRWGMAVFAVGVIAPVVCGIIYSKHPHDKLLGPNGLLFYSSTLIWLIPFYIGISKTSAMRIDFGRKYAGEGRWKEAAAALRSFTEFGQRSFDRTGEAHYLLAQAYDKLGRKADAEKARQFVRKNRSTSEWAAKLGVARPLKSASGVADTGISQLRKKGIASDGDSPAEVRKRAASIKGRRRRF